MKENKYWISLTVVGVVATIVAFSVGYLFAHLSKNQSDVTVKSDPLESSELTQRGQEVYANALGKTGALNDVAVLEDLARFKSHFERNVALNALLQDATVDSLQASLEQSKSIDSIHWRESTQQAIFQRLATFDPKEALEQIDEMPIETRQLLIQTVFQEWSLANLDQAIEQASLLGSIAKLNALEGILVSVEHMTQEEQRAIARRLGNEWLVIERIQNENGAELFEDPEREWASFLENNKNSMQSLNDAKSKMLVFITSAWIARDGIEAFEKIRASFPSQYPLSETVSSVVDELFLNNPQLAFELAATVEGISTREREELTRKVLNRWAKSVPQEALEVVNQFEARYLRRQFQLLVLEAWATTDAHKLTGLIKSLPIDLQAVAREKALIAMAKTAPADAVELLTDISDRHSHLRVAEIIAIQWAKQDVFGALSWIEDDERLASVREHLTKSVFEELSRTDPQLAFETALTHPPDSKDRGMEVYVLQTLAFGGDLDKAISLLPQTRKGATKTHAYESIINSLLLVEEDTMRSQDAVDLFIQATKTDSVKDIGFMLMNVAWKAPLVLFDSLDEFPSDGLQQKVAGSLLLHNESNGMFTEGQLAELRELKQKN